MLEKNWSCQCRIKLLGYDWFLESTNETKKIYIIKNGFLIFSFTVKNMKSKQIQLIKYEETYKYNLLILNLFFFIFLHYSL